MKQPEARQHAEAELEEFLDGFVAELGRTPFAQLWDRLMVERRFLRWSRAVPRDPPLETLRGPRGGAFLVQVWAARAGKDLHVFVSAQSREEPDAEANRDLVVSPSD